MNLENIRSEIDIIDDQIAALFNKRMEIVGRVAEYKKLAGTQITDKSREEAILARVCTGENGAELRRIFEVMFEVSRSRQKDIMND